MTPHVEHIDTSTNQYPHIQVRHFEEWKSSGVDDEIISRNVWSIEDPQEVDKLLNRNTNSRWKHSEELCPGWAVAGVSPKTGEKIFKGCQYKPDTAPLDPRTQKPRKYFSPSKTTLAPLFLATDDGDYWQRLMFDFKQPIILTEGAKKAGCLLSLGFPAISLPGVSTGGKLGRLRPELELFCRYGRTIYLAFDRDILSKKAVRAALHTLGRMLSAKGCMVYVCEWNNTYKGIDDYLVSLDGNLAARKSLLAITEQANTLEEWREEQEDRQDLLEGEKCRLAQRCDMVADKLKGRIRWNTLKSCPEIDGVEVDIDDLRLHLAVRHNIDIPSEDCASIVTWLARQVKHNPVMEFLKQCSEQYEPDSDLLDSIAERYLGTNSDLHRVFIRKTLISAVARAFNPGSKVDSVCILSGGQGVGKSTFWRTLAGDWFDDSVGSVSDKDERLKLHQAWLIEWAELEAVFKRKDISAVKAFITTQTDQIRPPYGRVVKEFPRPSIIVGTTNFDEFLADPTGNRRFWVVPVQIEFIPLDDLADERDRIWAAATHAFLQGESWALPREYKEMQREENADYQLSDPWEEPIANYIEDKDEVTATEILTFALNLDVDRHDRASQMRVTNILKSIGMAKNRKRIGKKRVTIWKTTFLGKEVWPVCPQDLESSQEKVDIPMAIPCPHPRPHLPNCDSPQLSQRVAIPAIPDPPKNFSFKTGQFSTATKENQMVSIDGSLSTPEISQGKRVVVIPGTARWFKHGSAKLPSGCCDRKWFSEKSIPLSAIEGEIFHELVDGGIVVSVSKDGQRAKVRNPETGRTSVFNVDGLAVIGGDHA